MTDSENDFRIFRMRVKNADGVDLSEEAWDRRGQVGVWYGAWSPEELDEAITVREKEGKNAAVEYMSGTPTQQSLGWKYNSFCLDTCRRFRDIRAKKDWVMVYFNQTLCIGQLEGEIKTDKTHKLNTEKELNTKKGKLFQNTELFHFRSVVNQKSFSLTELPDLYRLIPQSGRGNVHQYTNEHYNLCLKYLVKYSKPEEIQQFLQSLDTNEWLDFLSDVEWESLCLGYLILEYGYVPTGLLPGRTLKTYDLVGKTLGGRRILGQCKKSDYPEEVEDEFLQSCKQQKKGEWFWFSYGGWKEDRYESHGIKLVDKECMLKWLDSDKGKKYLDVFRGKTTPSGT